MQNALKIAFFVSIPVVAIIIFFLIFYPRIKKKKISNDFLRYVGKKVYKLSEIKDFYLLNQLTIPLDDDTWLHIDHLLFGNKYIYVITDKYFEGSIIAKEYDGRWVNFRSLNSRPVFIINPLIRNMERTEKISLISRIPKDMLISIVVCNNDLAFDDFLIKNPKQYFVKIKYFNRLINTLESDNKVGNISDDDLKYLVKEVSKLNRTESYKVNSTKIKK